MAKKSIKRPKTLTKKADLCTPIIWITITFGIILRLYFFINNLELTQDENIIATNILSRDFWGLFNPLSGLQIAPPLFLCITKILIFTNDGNYTNILLKLTPLLSSIGGVFAFLYLLRNIFINKYIIITGLILFALNPALINQAHILKPYSTDVLITILLTTYFIRYNPEGYWRQFLQILFLAFSMMISFPASFILTSGVFSIIFKDYKKFFYAIFAFSLFIIFYFIYHLWGIMEAKGAILDKYWYNYFITTKNIYPLFLNTIKTNFNIFIIPIASAIILGLGFLASCLRDKKFTLLSLGALSLLIITSYLHLYPFAPETTIFLIPIFIILTCEIFDLFPAHNIFSKIFPIITAILSLYTLIIVNFC